MMLRSIAASRESSPRRGAASARRRPKLDNSRFRKAGRRAILAAPSRTPSRGTPMQTRRSLRRIALTAAALTVVTVPASAQKSAPKASLAGFDQYITKTMQDWKDPGLAIAVVKDDSIVLMKGYGTRTMGKNEPVDEHTMFAIGSSSKAFTSTLVAMLVDQGKMKWDDPATAYLTGLQLYDPYVTRELTVRDLLTHRS